jgi:hypothetical protein
MRRLSFFSATLAMCCVVATPAFAQGDGAYQQAEREGLNKPQCQPGRGAGADQSLTVGASLPKNLRGTQSVVNDWQAHKLGKPSWRTQWVQVGGDYVLVDTFTNRIHQVRLNGC